MPNTAIQRVENCCMPPKKSAWRFENTKLIEHSQSNPQFGESDKIYYHNMGVMYEESKMKPVYPMQCYASVETFSRAKHGQAVDAPLDFSLKKCDSPQIKTEPVNHLIKQDESNDLKKDMINHHPTQMFIAPHMLNGNNSPPSPPNNNSPVLLDSFHVSSSCKDSDSLDMDCSQESAKSPSLPGNSSETRMNEIIKVSSPEHKRSISRTPSRENSPTGQSSILAEMLRGQQQQSNFGLSNRSQTFGPGYPTGLGVYESPIVTSPSPPMAVNTSIMHPANMLPITMAQYFGYGYVEPSNPFMQGYMYKPPEPSILDVSTSRKPKRKTDPFADSLKTCSVEELQKKLDSLSGGSLITNSDYAINSRQTYIPQMNNSRRLSNNTSLEPVKNTVSSDAKSCSPTSNRENNEIDNSVSNQNEINGKDNTVINQNQENNMIVAVVESNSSNSQNMDIAHQMNGANTSTTISCIDDTNDSQVVAIPESSFGRKKAVTDYKDDPNYRMKRAKNNMAARRSRESRRIKEEIIRKTAVVLEQKNIILTRENAAIKTMFDEAKMKYYTLLKEYENIKIQNSVLSERLNQKRCGQCGSTLPSVN